MTTARADAPEPRSTPPAAPPPALLPEPLVRGTTTRQVPPLPSASPFVGLGARREAAAAAEATATSPAPRLVAAGPDAAAAVAAAPLAAPEMGFVPGTAREGTLAVGQHLGRYGPPEGRFAAPPGTPIPQLSLPAHRRAEPYHEYTVLRPLPVREGRIAPWFGEPGGGVQYVLPASIGRLVQDGFLQETTP